MQFLRPLNISNMHFSIILDSNFIRKKWIIISENVLDQLRSYRRKSRAHKIVIHYIFFLTKFREILG
jgi:hypothetical protein